MLPMNFPGRRSVRQEEAQARQAARAKRSHADQLAHLDSLFGVGQGAKRERARIAAALDATARQAEEAAQVKAHQEQVRAAKQEAKAAAKAQKG